MPPKKPSSSSAVTSNPTSGNAQESAISRAAHRTYARRSCDVCKKRKTRCELPDFSIPASSTPLSEELACHRCKQLKLECVVSSKLRGEKSSRRRKKKQAVEEESEGKEEKPSTSLLHLFTPEATTHEIPQEGRGISRQTRSPPKDRMFVHSYSLILFSELVAEQQRFGSEVKEGSTSFSVDQILSLVQDRIREMEIKLKAILVHIPHLPLLSTATSEFRLRATPSTRLLLSTLLLLNLPSNIPNKLDIQNSLKRVIQRDLFQLLMAQDATIRSIQAFQLIAVYTPLTLVPGLVEEVPASGSLCLAAARASAVAIGLDRSMEQLQHLRGSHSSNGSLTSGITLESSKLAEKAVIWMSIEAWNGHFHAFEASGNASTQSCSFLPMALEFDLLSAFTRSSQDPEENSARTAGCVATHHRLKLFRTWSLAKPEISDVGEAVPLGEVRSRALIGMMDRIVDSLDIHRQSRDQDFSGLYPKDYYVKSIDAWLNLEASCVECSLFMLSYMVLLKEGLKHLKDGPARFYKAVVSADASAYDVANQRRPRQDFKETMVSNFLSLSSKDGLHAFGAPPRSTCSIILVPFVQWMERTAAEIVLIKRLESPQNKTLLSAIEVSSKLRAMDSESTELGSIPQVTSQIVDQLAASIKLWISKLNLKQGSEAPDGFTSSSSQGSPQVHLLPNFNSSSSHFTPSYNHSQPQLPEFHGQMGHNTSFISDEELDALLMNGLMLWPPGAV